MLICLVAGHDRLDDVLAAHDVGHVRSLIGDGLGRGEAASGVVLLSLNLLKLAFGSAGLEGGPYRRVGRLPHPAP